MSLSKSWWYDLQFLKYRAKQTFTPFYSPLMILNIKILKKWKRCLEILSFYTYMCSINEDHMIYGSWNTRCHRQKFSTFWVFFFFPFSPLITWKIKILTLKKVLGGIIMLHICTINNNYKMYGSWDMKHNRHNFLSFWNHFLPFTILHRCNINENHMMYGSWDTEPNGQNVFALLAP